MKLLIGLFGLLSLFGCVHVETPHQIGDRVELTRDVYLIECKNKSLTDIGVQINSNEKREFVNLPPTVDPKNIGESFLGDKVVGILKAGTILEILQFDFVGGVDYTRKNVLLKNIRTEAMYDLSDNNSLIDVRRIADGNEFFLTPFVFGPIK
jgi:hypothetical protein